MLISKYFFPSLSKLEYIAKIRKEEDSKIASRNTERFRRVTGDFQAAKACRVLQIAIKLVWLKNSWE